MVTYNTRGHLFPERDAEITDRLEDLFRRAWCGLFVDSAERPGQHLQPQRASDLH